MSHLFSRLRAVKGSRQGPLDDERLIARFRQDPEGAYHELLERFTPVLLRMIHRFMRDPDEAMEVYTSICERFRANDYQALRRFRPNSDLAPWLSVVVANACRDRFRKQRMKSVPRSVLSKLDEAEQLVFKYYYWERLPHEDIAEIVSARHGMTFTALDVVRIIEKINELLSVNKRWHLLAALSANRPLLSIDEMAENGFQLGVTGDMPDLDDASRERQRLQLLKEALETLESEDRLLVLLRFEHGMTAPEIAEIMHYDSHKYVYTRLRTVLNRLRRHVSEE